MSMSVSRTHKIFSYQKVLNAAKEVFTQKILKKLSLFAFIMDSNPLKISKRSSMYRIKFVVYQQMVKQN